MPSRSTSLIQSFSVSRRVLTCFVGSRSLGILHIGFIAYGDARAYTRRSATCNLAVFKRPIRGPEVEELLIERFIPVSTVRSWSLPHRGSVDPPIVSPNL